MGASLYATSPVFKSRIDRCHRCLLALGYHGILPLISSESGTTSDCKEFGAEEEFEAYQCAVLALEFAFVTLWKHWGVVPADVIGQSLGEYAAMVTADVLSIETALSIVAKRARLTSRACTIGKTGMVSVTLPSAQVQEVLATRESSFSNVTIACVNTESSCVVSGRCITSRLEYSREEHVHVHGDLKFTSVREATLNLGRELPTIEAFKNENEGTTTMLEMFTTHTAYEVVFPRMVEYAKDYHAIQSLVVDGDGASGVARISPPGSLGAQLVFLDTLLHVAGFMLNMRGHVSDAYICSGVGLLKVLHELVEDKESYTVYCTNNWKSSRDFVTADVWVVRECGDATDPRVVVAQVRGAQFRRVRLTSLFRGLAIAAANPKEKRNRMRTDSNAIIAPASPRSIISARSRYNTRTTLFCGGGGGLGTGTPI